MKQIHHTVDPCVTDAVAAMQPGDVVTLVPVTQAKVNPALGVAAGQVVDRLVQPGFWFATARNTGVWGHVGLDSHRARSGGASGANTSTGGGQGNALLWVR